jgi:hypothetical protein
MPSFKLDEKHDEATVHALRTEMKASTYQDGEGQYLPVVIIKTAEYQVSEVGDDREPIIEKRDVPIGIFGMLATKGDEPTATIGYFYVKPREWARKEEMKELYAFIVEELSKSGYAKIYFMASDVVSEFLSETTELKPALYFYGGDIDSFYPTDYLPPKPKEPPVELFKAPEKVEEKIEVENTAKVAKVEIEETSQGGEPAELYPKVQGA